MRFAAAVEARLASAPARRDRARGSRRDRPRSHPTIVACGPLPSDALAGAIDALLARVAPAEAGAPAALLRRGVADRRRRLARRDADVSQVALRSRATATTISTSRSTARSTRRFVRDLRELPKHEPKEFERGRRPPARCPYFEGCLPIEEMAARGDDVAALRADETGRAAPSARPATRRTPSSNCAKKTSRRPPTTSSVFRRG